MVSVGAIVAGVIAVIILIIAILIFGFLGTKKKGGKTKGGTTCGPRTGSIPICPDETSNFNNTSACYEKCSSIDNVFRNYVKFSDFPEFGLDLGTDSGIPAPAPFRCVVPCPSGCTNTGQVTCDCPANTSTCSNLCLCNGNGFKQCPEGSTLCNSPECITAPGSCLPNTCSDNFGGIQTAVCTCEVQPVPSIQTCSDLTFTCNAPQCICVPIFTPEGGVIVTGSDFLNGCPTGFWKVNSSTCTNTQNRCGFLSFPCNPGDGCTCSFGLTTGTTITSCFLFGANPCPEGFTKSAACSCQSAGNLTNCDDFGPVPFSNNCPNGCELQNSGDPSVSVCLTNCAAEFSRIEISGILSNLCYPNCDENYFNRLLGTCGRKSNVGETQGPDVGTFIIGATAATKCPPLDNPTKTEFVASVSLCFTPCNQVGTCNDTAFGDPELPSICLNGDPAIVTQTML